MRSSKTRAAALVCALISIPTAFVVWFNRQEDISLVHRGHRIGRLNGAAGFLEADAQWLSEREAIYLAYQADGDRFEFTKVRADTGEQSPVVNLNLNYARELKAITSNVRAGAVWIKLHEPPRFAVSPSGDSLFIGPCERSIAQPGVVPVIYHATDPDGSTHVKWQVSPTELHYYPPLWQDASTWLLCDPRSRTVVFNEATVKYRCIEDHHNAPKPAWLWQPVGLTAQNRLWGITRTNVAPAFGENTIDIAEWDLYGDSPPLKYRINLPAQGYVYGVALSTKRDRAAWMMLYRYVNPVTRLTDRLHNGNRRQSYNMCGIWVSDLNGSNMKEVGNESLAHSIYNDGYLRWLPGDKKLALHINRDLYTVPVDR